MSPNKSLQRSGIDKVLARGRAVDEPCTPARLMRRRAAAELSR